MSKQAKKSAPPYTTYTAFTNLIKDLHENTMPEHITRSVVKGSNSGKAMMMASLKYLGLIDEDSRPTTYLVQLVDNVDDYSVILKELLEKKYSFLFDNSINIKTTTTEKVAEKFQDAGAKGSTVSKCISFFLAAAKAAELEVSPRVKPPPITKSTTKRKAQKGSGETTDTRLPADETPVHEGMERITVSLRDMEDGIIYFPKDLGEDDARRAVKMATFILNQFYGIED